MNDSQHDAPLVAQRNRNAVQGNAQREIVRPIQGIDVPHPITRCSTLTRFFTIDTMGRKYTQNVIYNKVIRLYIYLSYEVAALILVFKPLIDHRNVFWPIHLLLQPL